MPPSLAPLAERLRPKRIADVVGQAHLLGADKPLGLAVAKRALHSMVLWGPPGVGKTTLARLLADSVDLPLIALSAVLAGVKDIRDAAVAAQSTCAATGQATVLFVDEVHRFNKSQQDALLPLVESGVFILIGATTENPSFEVNSALLSRAAVYVLQPLGEAELTELLTRGLAESSSALSFERDAQAMLIRSADGDGRKLLNNLEAVLAGHSQATPEPKPVTVAQLNATLSQALRRFDKGGEAFYDQISALHKSVRGSSPDAALYWFLRMIDGGADPLYLGRRIVRMAIEDIGLADPRAQGMCLEACQIYERLGSPEGELALSNAVIYLAIAPKSNAAYNAYNQAKSFVAQDKSRPVPLHLRNAPTKLMKALDYGKEYRYAHNEPEAYAAGVDYFPDELYEGKSTPPQFYEPTPRGLEGKIAEKLNHYKELDKKAKK